MHFCWKAPTSALANPRLRSSDYRDQRVKRAFHVRRKASVGEAIVQEMMKLRITVISFLWKASKCNPRLGQQNGQNRGRSDHFLLRGGVRFCFPDRPGDTVRHGGPEGGRGWPPGVVRGAARHASMASSVNQTVRLPRWRKLASYARQFMTLCFCLGMWRRS